MLKKTMVLLSALFVSVAHAEICPSVTQIKQNEFHGWAILNADSGEPLSASELKKFKRLVKAFSFAHWVNDAPEGPAQCYYRQTDGIADAYFAKNTLSPVESEGHWYKAGWGFLKCDAGLMACQFPDGSLNRP